MTVEWFDIIACICCAAVAVSCFVVHAWSAPKARLMVPMPPLIRLGHLAVGTAAAIRLATLVWVSEHPTPEIGHTDVVILTLWLALMWREIAVAHAVFRKRRPPMEWEVVCKAPAQGTVSRRGP